MNIEMLHSFVGLAAQGKPDVDLKAKGAALMKSSPQLMDTVESVIQPISVELALSREVVRRVAEALLPAMVEKIGRQVVTLANQRHDEVGMGYGGG